MIRMIRTKNLRALQEGAELASVLEADLETAETTIEAGKENQARDAEQLQKLSGEARDLRVELVAAESRNKDFARLVELLGRATQYAFDAADAPVHVVQHEGRARSAHRDGASARAATPYPDDNWVTSLDPDSDPLGWRITATTPPPLAPPECAGEIEALLERLERPALEQLAEADSLQELTRQLEAARSQRDTAMQDTDTAAAALTAEALAHAFHRTAVTAVVTEMAFALLSSDTDASVREVSGLLLRHADLFGIDPHGPKTGADAITKGAVA
ncbi:hypothetical protein GTY67_34365 [Streptomyces sp. SID8374]|uniref:hypothetical protein n=1 Tax=Streptomyces sp. SID8374 TaxID=2690354 RepID=UPI00136EF1E0|nr:hypothetical protein [Streptomyces sp. SID8374]MYX18435.1 hypothetical protein [Streptomyces sp. SID8374]